MAQPGVMLYFSSICPILDELNMESRGELLTAIMYYAQSGTVPQIGRDAKVAFAGIRVLIDKDRETYRGKVLQKQYAAYCRELQKNGLPKVPYEDWLASREPKDNALTSDDIIRHQPISDDASRHPITVPITTTITNPITNSSCNNTGRGAQENPGGKIYIYLITQEGAQYPVTGEHIGNLRAAFPEISVEAEVQKARAWLEANPSRRKAAAQIEAFLYAWMAREDENRKKWAAQSRPAEKKPAGFVMGQFERDAIARMLREEGELLEEEGEQT